jgi:hypothetical protein
MCAIKDRQQFDLYILFPFQITISKTVYSDITVWLKFFWGQISNSDPLNNRVNRKRFALYTGFCKADKMAAMIATDGIGNYENFEFSVLKSLDFVLMSH